MHVGVEVGGDSVNRFIAVCRAQRYRPAAQVDPKLQQMIDWGWYGVIAKPLFLATALGERQFRSQLRLVHRPITIAINVVLLPLRLRA